MLLVLSIFSPDIYIMLLSFLPEHMTNQFWMLLIFLTVLGIEWNSLEWEKRAHGTRDFMYSTIELLWHWRWLKNLEVALKHGISVLPFFFFFLYSQSCQEYMEPVISCSLNPPSFCSSKLCVPQPVTLC